MWGLALKTAWKKLHNRAKVLAPCLQFWVIEICNWDCKQLHSNSVCTTLNLWVTAYLQSVPDRKSSVITPTIDYSLSQRLLSSFSSSVTKAQPATALMSGNKRHFFLKITSTCGSESQDPGKRKKTPLSREWSGNSSHVFSALTNTSDLSAWGWQRLIQRTIKQLERIQSLCVCNHVKLILLSTLQHKTAAHAPM